MFSTATQAIAAMAPAHPFLIQVIAALCMLVTMASTVDMALPQPAPGSHWLPIRKAISFMALAFGNARNATQPSLATLAWRLIPLLVKTMPAGSAIAVASSIIEQIAVPTQAPSPAPAAPQAPATPLPADPAPVSPPTPPPAPASA